MFVGRVTRASCQLINGAAGVPSAFNNARQQRMDPRPIPTISSLFLQTDSSNRDRQNIMMPINRRQDVLQYRHLALHRL